MFENSYFAPKYDQVLKAGLWIRIQFLRIRIQRFFSMRIRIQLKKLYEEFAVVEKKDCSKVKTMELFLEKFNKITIITNFLAFFLLLFFLAYPDPGGKMNEV